MFTETYQRYAKRENDNLTQLSCGNCTKCDGNKCTLLNRYIDRTYNKCANHQDFRVTNPIKRV